MTCDPVDGELFYIAVNRNCENETEIFYIAVRCCEAGTKKYTNSFLFAEVFFSFFRLLFFIWVLLSLRGATVSVEAFPPPLYLGHNVFF